MLNFLKTKVPTGDTKELTEIESWTVNWGTATGWGGNYDYHHKVFTSKPEAEEFERHLKNAVALLQCKWAGSEIKKN